MKARLMEHHSTAWMLLVGVLSALSNTSLGQNPTFRPVCGTDAVKASEVKYPMYSFPLRAQTLAGITPDNIKRFARKYLITRDELERLYTLVQGEHAAGTYKLSPSLIRIYIDKNPVGDHLLVDHFGSVKLGTKEYRLSAGAFKKLQDYCYATYVPQLPPQPGGNTNAPK